MAIGTDQMTTYHGDYRRIISGLLEEEPIGAGEIPNDSSLDQEGRCIQRSSGHNCPVCSLIIAQQKSGGRPNKCPVGVFHFFLGV